MVVDQLFARDSIVKVAQSVEMERAS
jgi:hypothetical protein